MVVAAAELLLLLSDGEAFAAADQGYGQSATRPACRADGLTACVNLLVSERAKGGCRRRADGWPDFQATDHDDNQGTNT